VLLNDARVGGPDSGERPIHMGQAYVLPRQRLPKEPQYIALGHVHMPQQEILANAYYCGSLLQLDFGEAGQKKGVYIADVRPRRTAGVRFVELTSPRQLRNLGSHKAGLSLEELKALAPDAGDDYVKVFVKVDRPLPGLAEQVREILPNAVDIVVERPEQEAADEGPRLEGMTPAELFSTYYRAAFEGEPREEMLTLFNRLYEEVAGAPD